MITPAYRRNFEKLRLLAVLAMLGTLMFISKMLMDALPNIHMVGMLIGVYTLVYRVKALIPIYVFVFLTGLFYGFSLTWWLPYLYVWTILWAFFMMLPKNMPPKIAVPVYTAICGLHGFIFGTLFAPVQAIAYGFSLDATIAWIISGIPFDIAHGVGNLVLGLFIYPLAAVLAKLEKKSQLFR